MTASFDGSAPSTATQVPTQAPPELPRHVAAALWRGSDLGTPITEVRSTGHAALDAELPGGGWPCRSLIELLQPQPSAAEWRLLGATARQVTAEGSELVLVGPPRPPHLPGLQQVGVDTRHLVWIQAETPAERLKSAESLIKANAAGLLLVWLPQAQPEQIRRLQIQAHSCDGLVVLCRPIAAAREPSAAPLRLLLRAGLDWELELQILKRKGATHEGTLRLPSIPAGLDVLLSPRLRQPSALFSARRLHDSQPHEVPDVVGSPASRTAVPDARTH